MNIPVRPETGKPPVGIEGLVQSRRLGDVVVLTLAAPDGNRFNPALTAALHQALTRAQAKAGLRGIVLTSAADFCAGPWADLPPPGPEPLVAPPVLAAMSALCGAIEAAPCPVVCALKGRVSGGGLSVALACHARLAAPGTVFTCPEPRLGRLPSGGGAVRLAWRIGAGPTLALAAGGVLGADQALAQGLIDGIEAGDLLAAAAARMPPTPAAHPGLADPAAFAAAIRAARAALPVPLPRHRAPEGWLLDVLEAAQLLPPEQALAFDLVHAQEAAIRPESRALAHLARAARRALDPAPRPVAGAVLVAFDRQNAARWVPVLLREGAQVRLIAPDRAELTATLEAVAAAQLAQVRAGRLTQAAAEADWARLSGLLGIDPAQPPGIALADGAHLDWLDGLLPGTVPLGAWLPLGEGLAQRPRVVPLVPAPTQPVRLCEVVAAPGDAAEAVAALALQLRLTPLRALGGPVLAPMIRAAARVAARLRALGVTPDALAATGILPPGLDAGEAAAGGAALPLPVERLILLAVVNAGARLLATGRALRPSDLDLAMVLGAGWPNWRGGPMAEADGLGLLVVRHELRQAAALDGELWQPEPLLDEMIRQGWRFGDLNAG